MALQVWLPLTGNLDNQGLSDITVTNNGATVDNSGKLGQCYNFVGNYIAFPKMLPNPCSQFSVAGWVKLNTGYATNNGFHLISFQETYSRICISKDSLAVRVLLHNGSTNYLGGSDSAASKLVANVWNHYAITFDIGVIKIYINGQLDSTKTANITAATFTPNEFRIGTFASENANGCANDVRVYDHALSAKEVQLLSQGLVCHYKLNDNVQQMNNCFNYPTFDTSTATGGWSHWGSSGNIGTWGQNTDKNYIFNVTNNYSHWVANGEGATKDFLCYQSPAFEGGYRSMCCIIKEENSLPITNSIVYPTWNDNDTSSGVALNEWTSIQSLEYGFYLCKCEGFKQKGSNDLMGVYIKPGYKVYISEAYLENDRTVCSNIFYPSNVVYDSSGYNYHGTKIGDLTVSSDTSRYSVSTHFNGTSYSYLTSISPEIVSISLWVKWDSIPSGQSVVFMDYKSKIGFGLMSTGILCGSVSGTYNTFNKSNIVANIWYHFVIVSPDGASSTTRKLYINGVEQTPTSYTSVWSYSVDELQIGRRSYTSDGFVGKISDFRAYATALSPEDIQQLYNAPVSISNNGAMLTQGEFVEV